MDRLDKILKLREEGNTLEKIGIEFGITKERVRQILFKQGVMGKARYAEKVNYNCQMCRKKCVVYLSIRKTKRGQYCSRKCWSKRNSKLV